MQHRGTEVGKKRKGKVVLHINLCTAALNLPGELDVCVSNTSDGTLLSWTDASLAANHARREAWERAREAYTQRTAKHEL